MTINILRDTYEGLGRSINSEGERMVDQKGRELVELVNIYEEISFNIAEATSNATLFRDQFPSYEWNQKMAQERTHYNKLRAGLAHSFAENYYYMKEDPDKTRRIISLSTDCISGIAIQIRPPSMYISAFFRSSHYTYLLPADLYFLTNLFVDFLEEVASVGTAFGGDWNLNLTEANLGLFFSSLHDDWV